MTAEIKPTKVRSIIQSAVHPDIQTKIAIRKEISTTITLMDDYPQESTEDKTLRELRQGFTHRLKTQFNSWVNMKKTEIDDDGKEIQVEDIEGREELFNSLDRFRKKLFTLYLERKKVCDKEIMVGKGVQEVLSCIISSVITDLLRHGINNMKTQQLHTLYNRHVFYGIEKLSHYPMYSSLDCIRRFIDYAQRENEAYMHKSKSRSSELSYDYVESDLEGKDQKFGGNIKSIFNEVKEVPRYRISKNVTDSLSLFIHEFISRISKSLKKLIQFHGKVTIKTKHVELFLELQKEMHSVPVGQYKNALNKNYIKKKVEKEEEEDDEDQEDEDQIE